MSLCVHARAGRTACSGGLIGTVGGTWQRSRDAPPPPIILFVCTSEGLARSLAHRPRNQTGTVAVPLGRRRHFSERHHRRPPDPLHSRQKFSLHTSQSYFRTSFTPRTPTDCDHKDHHYIIITLYTNNIKKYRLKRPGTIYLLRWSVKNYVLW